MNTPSPLIPQGSFLDKPGRSHIRIAVFTILAIHVVLLGALLLQGCKRTTDAANGRTANTNAYSSWQGQDNPPPPMGLSSNLTAGLVPPPTPPSSLPPAFTGSDPVGSKPPNPDESNTSTPPTTPPNTLTRGSEIIPPPPTPSTTASREDIPTPPISTTGTEYVILKGDTFSVVAKRFGVKPQEIAKANPTVDPRRLQIGQKIFVPAASADTAAATVHSTGSDGATGKVYVVKSGDTLSSIATKHKTTVNKLRSANALTTDRITVGQKLKLPE